MFKFYIKSAFRNIRRYKAYSTVIIGGFAVGITVFLLISFFVRNELSYDRFNKNVNRIYRLERVDYPLIVPGSAPILRKSFPEIESVARVIVRENNVLKNLNSKQSIATRMLFTEPSFFNIFSYKIKYGNSLNPLQSQSSILLFQKTARKFFPFVDNPIGKSLQFPQFAKDFSLTGIISDPHNSHLDVGAILPLSALEEFLKSDFDNDLTDNFSMVYILVRENTDPHTLEKKINQTFSKIKTLYGMPPFLLRPLKDIYFSKISSVLYSGERGNYNLLKVFNLVGIIIIILVTINFINLGIARACLRAREVGVKKVVGEDRKGMIFQFLVETQIIVFIAFFISLILIEILLPIINALFQLKLIPLYIFDFPTFIILIGSIVFIGLVAGIIPAFYLSSFQPALVLKAGQFKISAPALFRKILTVFQFIIASILIFSTIIIYMQLNFMKNQNLGFRKENVIVVPINRDFTSTWLRFKKELLTIPGVNNASYSLHYPGENWFFFTFPNPKKPKYIRFNSIDPDYFKTMGITFLQGRNFSFDNKSDTANIYQSNPPPTNVILNESCARMLRVKHTPTRLDASRLLEGWTVIGIIKDFNYNSLHFPILPAGFVLDPNLFKYINIRISPSLNPLVLSHIDRIWYKYSPHFPFHYLFLDEFFNRQYAKDERMARIFSIFTILAFFIAAVGIFSMTSFIVSQRTKEIGIRKVHGARTIEIFFMVIGVFFRWVITANLLAFPVAYLIMKSWLRNFAFHIQITPFPFFLSLLAALIVVLITVSYQIMKIAMANPVHSLRYE